MKNKKYCSRKCRWEDPAQHELTRRNSIKQMSDPDQRKLQSESHKQLYIRRPELKKNASIKQTKNWQDPKYRENQEVKQKQVYTNCPEKRIAASKRSAHQFSDPKQRALQSKVHSQLYKDRPELAENHSKTMKEKFKNPKYAAKHKETRYRNLNKTEFEKYRSECKFHFNFKDYPEEFDFEKVKNIFRPEKNKSGYARDHMVSVFDGFKLKIDPKIISHPANCQIITYSENSKKHRGSNITLEELQKRIKLWDEKFQKEQPR